MPDPNCEYCLGTGKLTNEGTFTPDEGEGYITFDCDCIDTVTSE